MRISGLLCALGVIMSLGLFPGLVGLEISSGFRNTAGILWRNSL